MSNASIEFDSARAILSTYHQVNDTPQSNRILRTKLQKKNKDLEQELTQLREKYLWLQNELMNRDKKLATLNRELVDKTSYVSQLQDDFENAIYQLTHKSIK